MFKELSHVGIVVDHLERSVSYWCDTFGWVVVERMHVDSTEAPLRNAWLSAGGSRHETTCVELMEPLDKTDMSNAVARRLSRSGEGVYHIGIRTDDPNTAASRLRAKGVTVIEGPAAFEGESVRTIVHPRCANGVLLELA